MDKIITNSTNQNEKNNGVIETISSQLKSIFNLFEGNEKNELDDLHKKYDLNNNILQSYLNGNQVDINYDLNDSQDFIEFVMNLIETSFEIGMYGLGEYDEYVDKQTANLLLNIYKFLQKNKRFDEIKLITHKLVIMTNEYDMGDNYLSIFDQDI